MSTCRFSRCLILYECRARTIEIRGRDSFGRPIPAIASRRLIRLNSTRPTLHERKHNISPPRNLAGRAFARTLRDFDAVASIHPKVVPVSPVSVNIKWCKKMKMKFAKYVPRSRLSSPALIPYHKRGKDKLAEDRDLIPTGRMKDEDFSSHGEHRTAACRHPHRPQ